MKKNILYLLIVFCTMSLSLFAQKRNEEIANKYLNMNGEVIFSFAINHRSELRTITKEFAIVDYDDTAKTVKVMANQTQFSTFLQKKIPFQLTAEDNVVGDRTMISDLKNKAPSFPLTAYPTYAAYESMMNGFAADYPSLCQVENIGATTEGDKSLLFVKLSDNVAQDEQEPRVMFTSSMHGDEIAGYPMMLNLIDYLLNAYTDTNHPKHAEIKNLLDNSEVWINPSANPDGTYRGSADNTSVAGAIRGNANNVDLNRNYPDPDDGPNPDGNSYQTETIAFMNFADTRHFVLSANFHGGIELMNYPWDTYAGAHPDEDYFVHICSEYRDLCQANSPSGYFDDRNNGITNGYEWYEVQGGRQDYQIFVQKGREVTVELSSVKAPAASQLVNYWNYNREALLAFLMQVNYGIRGVVTNAATNEPIEAKVTIVGKENYETWSPTELPEGDYYRPVKAGTYDVLYEAPCYESVTLTNVSISDYAAVVKNVQLTPVAGVAPTGLTSSNVQATTATLTWNASSGASYDLRYRTTGSSNWTTTSSAENTLGITGLLANTTYEAQVRSKCSGGVGSPYSASITFTTTEPQACAGISSFPYREGFESGLGAWTQATSDNIDWTRQSGGTPSSDTGPSSANEGDYYIYVEASDPNFPAKTAALVSPCFSITSLDNPVLTFDYQMYGSQVNSLTLEVSEDAGSSWTQIFEKSGEQGNAWTSETIALNAYKGSEPSFRFTVTTGTSTSNGWQSDIALDHIRVEETGATPPASYCVSKGDNVNDEYIERVQIGTIDNNSGVNGGYADFTGQSTSLTKGESASVTITPAWTGTVYSEGYSIWIDLNQDGDFEDAGEQVFTQSATQNTPISGSITVPNSAPEGSTRMRVAMKYNGVPASCETFQYGEVEDYTVIITSKPSAKMNGRVEQEVMSVYPNPIEKDILYIKNIKEAKMNVQFSIRNHTGQLLQQGKLSENTIDVGGLSNGMYILEIHTSYKSMLHKFIIAR